MKLLSSYNATTAEKLQVTYLKKHHPLIRLFVSFDGRIDEKVLRKAIDLSITKAPLISCIFSFEKNKWIKKSFSSAVILNTTEKKEKIDNIILSDIDFSREPQIKIFLVKGKKQDSLCFIASHLAFDGMALKRYVYLIAGLYNRNLGFISDKETLFGKYNLDRSFYPVFHSLSILKRFLILMPIKKNKKQNIILPFSQSDNKSSFFVKEEIPSRSFLSIKRKAITTHVTINDLIMTSYAFALSAYSKQNNISFSCPVSLLKKLPSYPNPAFSNLTSVFHFQENIDGASSFSDILKNVHRTFEKQKKSTECYKGPFLLSEIFRFLPSSFALHLVSKIASPPIVSYTNLGILEKDKMRLGTVRPVDAFVVTAVKNEPSFQLSVSTFSDTIHLTSAFFGTKEDRELIKKNLTETAEAITEWADS